MRNHFETLTASFQSHKVVRANSKPLCYDLQLTVIEIGNQLEQQTHSRRTHLVRNC